MASVTADLLVLCIPLPALPRHVRVRCEATIERLIAFLDAYDLECDDEPSLGVPELRLRESAIVDGL